MTWAVTLSSSESESRHGRLLVTLSRAETAVEPDLDVVGCAGRGVLAVEVASLSAREK